LHPESASGPEHAAKPALSLSMIDAEIFLAAPFQRPDLIVDALLGSGQNRPPEGIFAELLERMAAWQSEGSYALSMDVPSGLLEDRAFGETEILIPDEIHTYGPHRLACFLTPHLAAARILSNPIGFVPFIPGAIDYFLMHRNPDRLDSMRKSAHEHKYVSGAAWILGGSRGMEGALLLSAGSFFASGGGILWGLGEDRSKLLHSDPAILWSETFDPEKRPGAVVIGPGATADDARRYMQMVAEPLLQIWKDAAGGDDSVRAPKTSPNSAANLQQRPLRTDQVGGQSEETPHYRTFFPGAGCGSHVAHRRIRKPAGSAYDSYAPRRRMEKAGRQYHRRCGIAGKGDGFGDQTAMSCAV
ncbi:MAG: hypothetical protein KDK33_13595, partial [Leptospiraceae bacterium]|nr:hypothetical protein [Leptospiraceae bacterium]